MCPIARFASREGSPFCEACRAGSKGIQPAASSCELCTEGRYQPEDNQTSCIDCEIGRYNNCQGSGFCFPCEKGTTTYEPASKVCVLKRINTIPAVILDNETYRDPTDPNKLCISWVLPKTIRVPGEAAPKFQHQIIDWSRIRLFPDVDTGRTNSTTVSNTTTSLCIYAGLSYPAVYSDELSLGEKLAFDEMPLDDVVTYIRITPFVDDAYGTSSAPSKVWTVTSSCDDESYLDSELSDYVMKWKCLPCPIGGDCRGNVRWEDVQPIFGYFRLHSIDTCEDRRVETSFWPCFKPEACLGTRNPKLEGRYYSDRVNESRAVGHTIDLAATEIKPDRCNFDHGYENNCSGALDNRCRLCRGCAKGYWPSGHARCVACPSKFMQGLAIFCGICAVIIILYLFLATALQDASLSGDAKVHMAQPMQKIALNHMQLVALAASFPLQWPEAVETLFTTFGVLGDAGDYIFNPACEDPDADKYYGGGSLFFQKQLMVLMMPFGAVAAAAVFWSVVRCYVHQTHRRRKLRSKEVREKVHRRLSQAREQIELTTFTALNSSHNLADESKLSEDEKRYRQEQKAAKVIQLWYARRKGYFAQHMKSLAENQVSKENKVEAELRMKAKVHSAAILGETKKMAESTPSSYHGKHSVAYAVDHAAIIDSQIFDDKDEIIDAAMWPSLLEPSTFIDSHVSKETVQLALQRTTEAEISGSTSQDLVYFDAKGVHMKISDSNTGRSKIVKEKWLGGGRLERWLPANQVENLPPGHQGAWRVRFKPQFAFDRDVVVYMSNTEAVACRKRKMPDERHRKLGVLNMVHELADTDSEAGISSITLAMKKKSRKCERCGRITIVELKDTRDTLKKGQKKSLKNQKSYKKMTARERRRFKRTSANLNRRIFHWDKFIATVVTCLYLLYPTVTRATFKLVACQTVGCNRYLQMDLDLECWGDMHIPWVILLFIPALLLYVLGLPLLALYFLRKHRDHLDAKIPRFHFGILYLGFRHECYYWEVLTALRKTTIICVAVFLTAAGTEVQALTGSFINLIALLLHMNFRPYMRVTKDHNTLHLAEMWALVVSFSTLWMGLFFFQENVTNDKPLSTFLTVILLIGNSVYVIIAFRWFLILKLIDLEARDAELHREGMDRKKGEIGYVMEQVLKKLVPEWYTVNSIARKLSFGSNSSIKKSSTKSTVLVWKCGCGHINEGSHTDTCVKCHKIECECSSLLELHPLDKISLMSRLSGTIDENASTHTSSDTKDGIRKSLAMLKATEIETALPHLKNANGDYDSSAKEFEAKSDEIAVDVLAADGSSGQNA